jgi:diphosphomevalonate decarboxylase
VPAVEVKSPTNIALIKYWGKHPKYEHLLVPTKSSISFTIAGLFAKTILKVDSGNLEIEFYLNGNKISEARSEFDYVREFFDKISHTYQFAKDYRYEIKSQNDFPTASGFASSAAGFSALALAFASAMTQLGRFPPLNEKQLSVLARLGSGSAARSVPSRGGLVIWHRGFDNASSEAEASELSYAETLYDPSHFNELAVIYAKVEPEREKETKSRAGMKESVRSVFDYWQWVDYEEKLLLPSMLKAIKERHWSEMFKLIKQASNNFHAVCLRTVPPIIYLNDKSAEIIRAIEPLSYAAYTFDAGPNAVVFSLKSNAEEIEGLLQDIVGKTNTFRTAVGDGPKEARP